MRKLDSLQQEKEEEIEEEWDIKRIIIGVIVLVVLIVIAYSYKDALFPPEQYQTAQRSSGRVEGARTHNYSSQDYSAGEVKVNIQKKVEDIKDQVNNLDPSEVAKSSPQLQKVLNDLKNLENYPKDQARQMCLNICSSL